MCTRILIRMKPALSLARALRIFYQRRRVIFIITGGASLYLALRTAA